MLNTKLKHFHLPRIFPWRVYQNLLAAYKAVNSPWNTDTQNDSQLNRYMNEMWMSRQVWMSSRVIHYKCSKTKNEKIPKTAKLHHKPRSAVLSKNKKNSLKKKSPYLFGPTWKTGNSWWLGEVSIGTALETVLPSPFSQILVLPEEIVVSIIPIWFQKMLQENKTHFPS